MSDLYTMLAEAYGQPSRGYRDAETAANAVTGIDKGLETYRKRQLEKQSLGDALGGLPLEEGILKLTGETGALQDKNIGNLIALQKAKKEARHRATQLFGTQGGQGLVYSPDDEGGGPGTISTIPLPNANSDQPILPKAVSPTLSPYADPGTGQPLQFTPGRGLAPTASRGSGTPVLKQGNEQAISDVALMQSQAGNIDKLFDSYKNKGPIAARAQATPIGSILDPESKQVENSLRLAAFTFGGKNLTGQEKQVVFGAFFPRATDNAASLEQKRSLLKDYFTGKVDLLQAANLLGPAGAPLRGMLQNKIQPSTTPQSGPRQFNSPEEAEASGYKGPAIIAGKRAVIE
jgi:hypothetical protein